jgi:hypothetical protein
MMNEGSWPTLVNVTFLKNTAGANGGGILNHTSRPMLTNVTFSGNSAVYGGGLCNTFSSFPNLVNVTFTGNMAPHGSGMASVSSNPTITNTIIWGNAPFTEQIYNDNSRPVITYSNIERGYTGTGNMMVNPRLDALHDNGGLIMTHALRADSLLIDKGNPDPEYCPQTDPRGLPRPYDGNADGESRCDIGAFEYLPAGVVLVSKFDSMAGAGAQKLAWRTSIQDLLKLLGLDHSYAARRELAVKLGCPPEKLEDSAQMNTWLHNTLLDMLAQHGGNIPQELQE